MSSVVLRRVCWSVAMPPMMAKRMPRSLSVETTTPNACSSVDPLGDKESFASLTPLLPLELSGGQCPPAPLARRGVLRRHRPDRIQQFAQRLKPLGRRARLVQLNLPADAAIED